jgi:hypothetical protein
MNKRKIASESGLTLIEVLLAMVVFIGGGVAFFTGIATTTSIRADCADRFKATEAVLGIAEEISATPIDAVVGVWGEGGTPGNTFSIPGLDEGEGEDAVLAGRIRIVTNETLSDEEIGMALGMPRDLDGDGMPTSTDVSTTALILPVIVEARWGPDRRQESFRIPVIVLR